jgi:hypothetical protein
MAVPRRDNWVGHSYICVLPDGFHLKAIDFTVCEHEYMKYTPPPQVTALEILSDIACFRLFRLRSKFSRNQNSVSLLLICNVVKTPVIVILPTPGPFLRILPGGGIF